MVAQQQDPMTMNGGSLLAMSGKECVALAVDKRFGSGPQVRRYQHPIIFLVRFPSFSQWTIATTLVSFFVELWNRGI